MASNNQNNQSMTARARMEELEAVRVRLREEQEHLTVEVAEFIANTNQWISLQDFLCREFMARNAARALITDPVERLAMHENQEVLLNNIEEVYSIIEDARFAMREATNRRRETRRILMAQFNELLDELLDGGDTDNDTDIDTDMRTSNTGAAPPDAPANQ